MRVFKIKDNVFKTEPVIISGCTYKQLIKWIKRRYPDYDEEERLGIVGTVIHRRDKKGNLGRIVWVRHLSKKPEDLGVLMHELFHLVVRVLSDKGVPIVNEMKGGDGFMWNGDETASYLFESYAIQCLEKI